MSIHHALKAASCAAFITCAGLLLPAPSALAQSDDIVAKVGDQPITRSDVETVAEEFAQQLAQVPETQRTSIVIDILVDMHLLAQAAKEAGLEQSESYKRDLALLTARALRNAYVDAKIVPAVDEAAIEAEYEALTAEFAPEEEVSASHILVETEDEAKALIKELDGGADFVELAKEKSTGPSGPNGGDLGYFGKGRMVPEFETAAFALDAGTYTAEPIKSEFGWHVIKVDEKRMTAPPSLDDIRGEIQSAALRKAFEAEMTALKDRIPMEIMIPETDSN